MTRFRNELEDVRATGEPTQGQGDLAEDGVRGPGVEQDLQDDGANVEDAIAENGGSANVHAG